MNVEQHITFVEEEGKRFADAAASTSLDAEIVGCPGWTMRDLVRHLAEIHLWAAGHVAQRATKDWVDDLDDLKGYWPELAHFWPDDADLVDYYRRTNLNLVKALKAAPVDLEAMTFLHNPSSPREMWARRQAHEIAVHRFDAELGADRVSPIDAALASDGIDEILTGFAPRGSSFPTEKPLSMGVHAEDTDDTWRVVMAPEGITTERSDTGPTDVHLSGGASDLYLTLWNRGRDSAINVSGDQAVLDLWHEQFRIRWS